MEKTMMDGYPDDAWFEELSTEMDKIVNEAEKRIASAPLIGSKLLSDILFERDRLGPEPQVFHNDPYQRINRLNLN